MLSLYIQDLSLPLVLSYHNWIMTNLDSVSLEDSAEVMTQ